MLQSKTLRRASPTIGFEKTTYYDTPQHLLKKHGLSLRIRQKAGRCEQTLKTDLGSEGGALSRLELSRKLDGNALDLTMFDDVPALAVINRQARARLAPVFHTQVRRTKIDLSRDGTGFELVYDLGQIVCAKTGRKLAEISELETEIKSGPPRGMFAFLAKLNEKYELQQFATSKADRGYAQLRRAHALKPQKHGADVPPAHTDAYAVLHAAMSDALAQYFANNLNLIAEKPEAIHQTRVAVRRMRAILRAFKHQIDYMDRKALNGELRWLQTKLGECRDWHVLRFDTAPKMRKRAPKAARELDRLAKAVHARKLPKALAIYNSRRAQRLILRIQLWLSGLPKSGGPDIALLRRHAMLGNLKRLRALGRLHSNKPIGDVHAIRILAKKMRYALEIFPRATDSEDSHALKALRRMQEMLGDFSDAAKCLELLSTARDPGFEPEIRTRIRLWAEKRMAGRIAAARPHYNALLRWGKELA